MTVNCGGNFSPSGGHPSETIDASRCESRCSAHMIAAASSAEKTSPAMSTVTDSTVTIRRNPRSSATGHAHFPFGPRGFRAEPMHATTTSRRVPRGGTGPGATLTTTASSRTATSNSTAKELAERPMTCTPSDSCRTSWGIENGIPTRSSSRSRIHRAALSWPAKHAVDLELRLARPQLPQARRAPAPDKDHSGRYYEKRPIAQMHFTHFPFGSGAWTVSGRHVYVAI